MSSLSPHQWKERNTPRGVVRSHEREGPTDGADPEGVTSGLGEGKWDLCQGQGPISSSSSRDPGPGSQNAGLPTSRHLGSVKAHL